MRRSTTATFAGTVTCLLLAGCAGTTVTKYPVSGTMVALPPCPGDDITVFNDGVGPAIKRANPDLAALAEPVSVTGPFTMEGAADGGMTYHLRLCGPGVSANGAIDGASTVARSFARTDELGAKIKALYFENVSAGTRIVTEPFALARFASDEPVSALRPLWRDAPQGR